MVNIRSKFIKAMGVVLSTGCMISNCAYIKATPKYSVKDIEPRFKDFTKNATFGIDKDNMLLNLQAPEADSWRSIVLNDLTDISNFTYYAQMLSSALDEDDSEAKQLQYAMSKLASKIDEVNSSGASKEVYYEPEDLKKLKSQVENFVSIVNSLDAERWGKDYIAVVDEADGFLQNLIFGLDEVVRSGWTSHLFKPDSVLRSKDQGMYVNLSKAKGEKNDMSVYEVFRSGIIQAFTESQNDFDKAIDEHKGNAIYKVFNLMLNKLYNDFLHLYQSVYGKGEDCYVGHRVIPALENERSKYNTCEYDNMEDNKYKYPCSNNGKYKTIGFKFHLGGNI